MRLNLNALFSYNHVTADDKLISLLRRLTKTNKDEHSAEKVLDISAGMELCVIISGAVYTYMHNTP